MTIDAATEVQARVAVAAVCRCRGMYVAAAFFLRTALLAAGSDRSLRGRVLQAVMSLASDQGDFDEALQAVEMAQAEYACAPDLPGLGRALVSRGVLFCNHGRYAKAIEAYGMSLDLSSTDAWYVRFAAFQGLGLAHILLGEENEALKNTEKALKAAGSLDLPPLRKAETMWLRGEILLRLEQWEEATGCFRTVLEIYLSEKMSDLDLALISLRLACAYYTSGNLEELGELAEEMFPLLIKTAASNKLVKGALSRLVSLGIHGKPPYEMLVGAYREMLRSTRSAPAAAHLAIL